MGDPFTIAVSVAGLTSLGIQLAQSLKKYADSALDAKGRILAISIDIELAVQVLKTLDATLQNSSSRVSMTDDAEKLAKDVINQCQDLFDAIKEMLPDLKLRIRKRDMMKWPTLESKVDLFRNNLEKIKLTLQLLMSVMIAAQPELIAQQRLEVRRLQEEEATTEARLATLRLQHDELLALLEPQEVNMVIIQNRTSGATSSGVFQPVHPIEEGATSNALPSHDTSSQDACRPRHQAPVISSRDSPVGLCESKISASEETDKHSDSPPASWHQTLDYVTEILSSMLQRASALIWTRDPEPKDLMQMLYNDYKRCLEQLSTLRTTIESTSQTSFRIEGDRAYSSRDVVSMCELIDTVRGHGESTINCLKGCLIDSVASRKIKQQAKTIRQASRGSRGWKMNSTASMLHDPDTMLRDDLRAKFRGISPGSPGCDEKVTDTQFTHDLPSVDDLVRRWTNISSNDTVVESSAASTSDSSL